VNERLSAIRELARTAGVRGTPTWMVNGFPVMGNLPLGYARQFIESQLEPGGR
jgi:protein-disulfide isomerase